MTRARLFVRIPLYCALLAIVLSACVPETLPIAAQSTPTASLSASDTPAPLSASPAPPWEPEVRTGAVASQWLKLHERFLATAPKANPAILFLGDSITANWQSRGKATWQSDYVPRGSVDLGIGGDTTQNVLWRIDNGELDGITPNIVVLLIGTNDLGHWSAADTAHGVSTITDAIHAKLPNAQILLLGIFPRAFAANSSERTRVSAANMLLATLTNDTYLHYLDIGSVFLEPDGSISRDTMADGLHPTAQGYVRWATAMDPTLNTLLGQSP